MGEKRRAAVILLFCLACALFNWPLVGFFLEADLFHAFAGLFAVLGLLAGALYLAVGRAPRDPVEFGESGESSAPGDVGESSGQGG